MRMIIRLLCFLMLLSHNSITYAGFAISSNRVIYNESERERSLVLANINDYPIVAQTWVDNGAGYPDQSKAPFIVLPAVFKMNPKGVQAVRIIHNGNTMPQDRESVFWLNLYEIPGKTQQQLNLSEESRARLDLAMNTQLKVFYRPKSLKPMDIEQISEKIIFSIKEVNGNRVLVCNNPTPYHLSFINIVLKQKDKGFKISNQVGLMVEPFSEKVYELDSNPELPYSYQVDYTLIDDQGYTFDGLFLSK
ncbi:molecular chaperone [Acinetobacter sp. ANC 4805]|uniref:fimbrial biogenesis chaperone n=1 Tax=Acinetobacter sp. ANC 4805 TaxID=2923425 RepID=UPI001F4AA939|nr:molecular chaperone [Acinetobacter sp. ANC 4805]MCH7312583.1 molecular chaperone [Acinetobacter sp. ANC 4805]